MTTTRWSVVAVAIAVAAALGYLTEVLLVRSGQPALTPPLTLALHGLVIARVPQLRLMFNGKAMTHRAAAPAVS